MTEPEKVVVCRLLDGEEMRGVAQAALEETVALVTLDEAPPRGEFVLELHAPGTRPVVLIATTAGEPMEPMFPVRVRPFDDEHSGQLLAFVCSVETETSQPVTRWSQRFDRTPSLLRLDTLRDQALGKVPAEPEGRASEPELDPLIGRLLATDKYRIESLIGEGSAGAVYRGRHVALDKMLAVKVLHPRFRADETFARRFLAEAKAASRLDHPNVTRVQDFGEEDDGLLYIVMELLRGLDLRQLIHENALPRSRRIEVMVSVLNALAAADDKGIVHRDIKPENVMVVQARDEDGESVDVVKVCDFGLATVKPRAEGGTDIRQAAAAMSWIAGTPEYMSPEQILGEDLDIRADLYACGVILFELLTGQLPFRNASVMHLMRQQLYDPPARLRALDPTIDVRLEAVVLRTLSKDRSQRPATPREMRNELRAASQSPRHATTRGGLPPSASEPPRAPHSAAHKLPAMTQARDKPTLTPEQIADRIMADVGSVLTALTGESTLQQFVRRLRAIVSAFSMLLERGAISPLADIASTLAAMAREPATGDDPRPSLSMRALEPLRHETTLLRVAQEFLAGAETSRDDARFLLSLGGQGGVQAVLDARRQLAGREIDREAFVSLMRAQGAVAAEPLTSTLAALMDEGGGDADFIEDVLRSLPTGRNSQFRVLGSTLAHHGAPAVRHVVVGRLPELLGDEAHRILRASTRDPEESVRIAAIESLRQIGGVDDAVVQLARMLLADPSRASANLQVVAIEALQDVAPEFKSEAVNTLSEALVPRSRSLMNVLGVSSDAEEVARLVAAARSLIALAGMRGREAVQRRVAVSRGELREALVRLLG